MPMQVLLERFTCLGWIIVSVALCNTYLWVAATLPLLPEASVLCQFTWSSAVLLIGCCRGGCHSFGFHSHLLHLVAWNYVSLNLLFHCLISSVHHCEVPSLILKLFLSSYVWFSFIHSHLQSKVLGNQHTAINIGTLRCWDPNPWTIALILWLNI